MFMLEGKEKRFPPKWEPQLPMLEERLALGFLDLMEVRFVDAFRNANVSWKTINRAAEKARKLFGKSHPFATRKFRTDGRAIFVDAVEESGEHRFYDIVADQNCLHDILKDYLYEGVEFDENDNAYKWFPRGYERRIVLDPNRGFGQPIVCPESVPTTILAQATRSGQSVDEVASWYEVSVASVEAAVEFERRLMAA